MVNRTPSFEMILSDEMGFREDSSKFVIEIPAGTMEISNIVFANAMKKMKDKGINYSEYHLDLNPYGSYTNTMESLINSTGGQLFILEKYQQALQEDFDRHVINCMGEYVKQQNQFSAIVATGYEKITLEAPLSSTSGTDTEKDGLTDWKEVNIDLLVWNTDGSITLPTLKYCMDNYSDDSYVIKGLDRFMEVTLEGVEVSTAPECVEYLREILENTRILPIHSNPVKPDSDGDGIKDRFDIRRLHIDILDDKYIELINNQYIQMSDIISTNDGFKICMSPLAEIFKKMGFPDKGIPSYDDEGIAYYFDDWYLFSVEDGEEIVYSIMLLREQSDKNSKVSIPFIRFDENLIGIYDDANNYSALSTEITNITKTQNVIHNTILTKYFKDSDSEALYLIPKLYINIVINKELTNTNILDVGASNGDMPCQYAMDTLNKYSMSQNENEAIYDSINKVIFIKDADNLTLAEKQCILAARTCNPSFNSFAAEVIYHAEVAEGNGYFGAGIGYDSAIKADMGIGEGKLDFLVIAQYKAYSGYYVEMVRNKKGDW